jgi:transcriptional regulator GlxA family with amidase domain
VVAHLEANYAAPIDGRKVAALCALSQQQFCRNFRRAFDMTLQEFVLMRRMAAARELLREFPRMKIAEVAVRCGYMDPNDMSRHFRRYHGVKPTEWRRLQGDKAQAVASIQQQPTREDLAA